MNRHLKDAELAELLDGMGASLHREHLDRCSACRSRVDVLRATLQDLQHVKATDVPEPSPLFWDHFSQRVRDAIAEAPGPRRRTWMGALAPAAAAVVLGAGGLFIWAQSRSHSSVPAQQHETAQVIAPASQPEPVDLEDDVEWALVRVAADDLEWDAAADAGLRANPGSAERVAIEMSALERQELERLIEAEIKQTGA
jgi:hypothetical protein